MNEDIRSILEILQKMLLMAERDNARAEQFLEMAKKRAEIEEERHSILMRMAKKGEMVNDIFLGRQTSNESPKEGPGTGR